jgi:exportin-2 (importin alpha re-exporter)
LLIESAPFLTTTSALQTTVLARVARNPTKPQFNHYMFEAIAALIRNITNANAATVPHFETALFPSFQLIIEQQVSGMLACTTVRRACLY